jgi:hypothetical protein
VEWRPFSFGNVMSKVKLILNPNLDQKARVDLLLGKKVEHVTQTKRLNCVGVPFIGWNGTTEDEFFVMAFVVGVLTISINEREMRLADPDSLSVAGFSKNCYDRLTAGNKEKALEYNNVDYHKELESLEFKDVMKLLKWTWKDKKN